MDIMTIKTINWYNLKSMFNHMLNVPELRIMMESFKWNSKLDCKTTGCVIGHCIELDDEFLPELNSGEIDYYSWSERFTGIDCLSEEWKFLFSSNWPNDKEQILFRIKYFIEQQKIPEIYFKGYDPNLPITSGNCFNNKMILINQDLSPYDV